MEEKKDVFMSDKHADYFEGILQLRNPTKRVTKFIRDLFVDNKRAWIAKELQVVNGIDFYISSQKYLRGLGTKLQAKFGGEIKNSRKLHTRDKNTQKELYRAYLMFRPSKYSKGDILVHRGERIKIINSQKEIFGINLETNRKVHIKYSQL